MTSNKQLWAVDVQLEKAKKAIQLLFMLSLLATFGIYSAIGLETVTIIQLIITVVLFISARIIYKYPIFAVIILSIVVLFYFWGWYTFLTGKQIVTGIVTSNIFGILLIFFRIFITGVAIGGLFFAIKGMMAKEYYEKKHGTLDEEEVI